MWRSAPLVLALALLPAAAQRSPAQGALKDEEKAVTALRKACPEISFVTEKTSGGRAVVEVTFDVTGAGGELSDKTLAHLASLKRLRTVRFAVQVKVSDTGLAALRGLKRLEELELPWSVGDKALEHVKGLPRLKKLVLAQSRVTDAGLAHLREMRSLEVLDLSAKGVTDAGLAHLRGLTGLRELVLSRSGVSGEGLPCLRGMKRLRLLDLRGSQLTHAALKRLPAAAGPRLVDVSDTKARPWAMERPKAKLQLRWRDGVARLRDPATGKAVSEELRPRAEPFWRERPQLDVTRDAVSPDGKLVAVGAGHKEIQKISGTGTNVGWIGLFDPATGKLSASWPRAIGSVTSLAFLKEGKTVVFTADLSAVDSR